jgi:leader peptidase (prepilin peptidase)/N-methyltransferase
VITKSDVETFEIPDWASIGVAIIGALAALSISLETFAIHLFSGVVVLAILWWAGGLVFRYLGREGLGIGDAKLIAAGTILLGPMILPMLILIASLGGIAAVLVTRLFGKAKQNPAVPFGPFIAYALFVLNLIPTVGA